ncbi:MAG: hypothetical protein II567_05750, partial [Candidatus Riflebacteria bacterium]|nr:hypothetical protein [Candidatus Riflebacteria bacterium]
MKRFLFLALLISTLFIAMQNAYASDIDDILKNLDSPEVDYHIDSEIKTIVVPQPEFYPAIKPDLKTKYQPAKTNTSKPVAVKKTNNQPKEKSANQNNKTAQKTELTSEPKNTNNPTKSSDSKEKDKSALKSVSKSEIKKETAKINDKKQNSKISDKNQKPLKVYSLFLFFKDMKVIKTWVNGINENLEFFKSFSETILVFWQQKVEEEEEEEDEEE